jgi:hypothetical protein
MTLRGKEPVILNGARLYIVTENATKPWYIPLFVWKWMVRTVVAHQTVTTEAR